MFSEIEEIIIKDKGKIYEELKKSSSRTREKSTRN